MELQIERMNNIEFKYYHLRMPKELTDLVSDHQWMLISQRTTTRLSVPPNRRIHSTIHEVVLGKNPV